MRNDALKSDYKKNLNRLLNRPIWKLSFAALLTALASAIVMQLSGLTSSSLSPVTFVSSLLALQVSLFTAWPLMSMRGGNVKQKFSSLLKEKDISNLQDMLESLELFKLNKKQSAPKEVALWNKKDPRLDVSLFGGNVPTMILDHEQRILDWNPAFDLVFGYCRGVRRGGHVTKWFDHLDNFRRISKRKDKLYGEGILSMADRDRVSYISSEYGRMVFRKIMTPILNQDNGNLIGWTVVLNINSVNKRAQFFAALHTRISSNTRAIRYAAAHDHIYKNSKAIRENMLMHINAHKDSYRLLEIGSGTGMLARGLLKTNRKVVTVENDVNLLRRLKRNTGEFPHLVRIVRQDPDQLRNFPSNRFDGVILNHMIHRTHYPLEMLKVAFDAVVPGGTISLSSILPSGGLKQLHRYVRAELESENRHDILKRHFQAVTEYELSQFEAKRYKFLSREDLRALVLEAGFTLECEESCTIDGHSILLIGKKPF
jgi:SAM-dependent methyltransferase